MKITLERLREIITEEVIKEELAPEIAAPAIAAMLQGMEAETTSDVFGDVFTHMYGEEALQAQADAAQPGEPAGSAASTRSDRDAVPPALLAAGQQPAEAEAEAAEALEEAELKELEAEEAAAEE